MTRVTTTLAVAVALTISGPAVAQERAAPTVDPAMTYDCDTAATHSSSFSVGVPSEGFFVKGVLVPYRAYPHPQVAATATVGLIDPASGDQAVIRLTTADAEAATYASIVSAVAGGQPFTAQGPRVATEAGQPFLIQVLSPDRVLVAIGETRYELAMRSGAMLKLTMGCTTGGFRFEQVMWGQTGAVTGTGAA